MACFAAPSTLLQSVPDCGLHSQVRAVSTSKRPHGARRHSAYLAAALTGAAASLAKARGRQPHSSRRAGKQIVVVGGGLAGLNLALRLDQMPWKSRPEVKLIDPKDRYVFLPLLIDYATGVVELDEFAPTYRELLKDTSVQHLRSRACEVDWRRRQVSLNASEEDLSSLSFDALVVASGSSGVGGKAEAPALPGLEEALANGKALCFRSLADAELLRRRLRDPVESVAIVGAGYVGVELASGLAEVLPEAAGRIALFGSKLLPGCEDANQKQSAQALDKLGIVRKTGRVVSLQADGLMWSPGPERPTELHSCDLVIVTGALAASTDVSTEQRLSMVSPSQEESLDDGRAVVDPYLRIAPGLFCLGDAAGGSPPTGQIAMQQAETTAWNVFAQLSHLPRPFWRRFKPNAMGEFIALGSTEAAGVVQPTQLGNLLPPALPPVLARAVSGTVSSVGQASTAKAAVSGRPASLLRRLAYLYRLPGSHRLKVAQQWLERATSSASSESLSGNVLPL